MNAAMLIKADIHPSRCFNVLGMMGQIGAAGIQSGANLAINSATNRSNAEIAKDTNSTNLQIARETNQANKDMTLANNDLQRELAEQANALNYQLFTEQNEWNENFWNMQNAYNDPSAQLERLINAGINPNMAVSGGFQASGNASQLPQSASPAPAEVADTEAPHFDPAHVDPYQLIPYQMDFLPALAQAAGVDQMRAETEGLRIDNEFKPQQYGTKLEADKAATQYLLAQYRDFLGSSSYRHSKRSLDLAGMQLFQKLQKQTLEENEKEFARRAELFSWAKDMHPLEMEKLRGQIEKIFADVHKLGVDELLEQAQMRHWFNEDQIAQAHLAIDQQNADSSRIIANATKQDADTHYRQWFTNNRAVNGQLKEIEQRIVTSKIDDALKLYMVKYSTRHQIAKAIGRSGYQGALEFIDGLSGARDGDYSPWYMREFITIPQPSDYIEYEH